jgi:hypothetical protein
MNVSPEFREEMLTQMSLAGNRWSDSAYCLKRMNRIPLAIKDYKESFSIFTQTKDVKQMEIVAMDLGDCYVELGSDKIARVFSHRSGYCA